MGLHGNGLRAKPPTGACVDELPAELAASIAEAYAANREARDLAVAAEQTRLNVEPLTATSIIARNMDAVTMIKPDEDPYPNSVVAVGEAHDIRAEGYEINHGKMGMTRIYETAPGSNQYFIVDRIGGDGIGGNGINVVAENVEYGLMSVVDTSEAVVSYHSWHVAPDNFLVRATQAPVDEKVDSVSICGCGPMGFEVDDTSSEAGRAPAGDFAPPRYNIGIFLLPGTELPRMGGEDDFKAEFPRTYYEKLYVPAEGKKCMEYDVVC